MKVVCGIILKGNTYFIARRKPEKRLGGYWEFPGGKIEIGEDPVIALKRELLEELGMNIKDVHYFGHHHHSYETFDIELVAYSCQFVEATFEMTDHDAYTFISKEEMVKYRFAPADVYFVSRLVEKGLGRSEAKIPPIA